MENKIEALVAGINEGFGYVAESMLQIYCDDDGLDWAKTRAYFNKHFNHKPVEGEEVWITNSLVTWKKVRKDMKEML